MSFDERLGLETVSDESYEEGTASGSYLKNLLCLYYRRLGNIPLLAHDQEIGLTKKT